jgi:glycosyltransferase involved in cell wall biosynthesis
VNGTNDGRERRLRIWLLTRHFPPDTGALSFRLDHLASALSKDHDVTVLAAQPNRYGNEPRAPRRERVGGIEIRRVTGMQGPGSRGKLGRLLSEGFGALAMTLRALRHLRKMDVAVASVPPLAYALPGWAVKRLGRKRLVVDVRDLWVDWADESGVIGSKLLLRLARRFERSAVVAADRVTVATQGFGDALSERYGLEHAPTVVYNGLDADVAPADDGRSQSEPGAPVRVLYAGNLGPSQNLMGIASGLADAVDRWDNLTVTIVGDGSQREDLDRWAADRLEVHPPVDRAELAALYEDADAFLLHLADLEVYRHTVPSKTFEYAGYGRPILCGVRGEARAIAFRHADCFAFESDDPASLLDAIERLIAGMPADNAGQHRADPSELMREARTETWQSLFAGFE